MQIRKCLLAVCFAVAVLSVQAADTEAQIKAHEALLKKLKEIDAQAAVTNAAAGTNAPAVATASAVTNAPTPAEPVPPAPQPAPAATAPVAATAAVATAAVVTAAAANGSDAQVPPATPQVAGVPTPADPATIEKARESMHKKMDEVTAAQLAAEAQAQHAAAQPPPSPKPKEQPSKPPKPQTSGSLPPMDAPPLPISAEKKQALDALLSRYRADQITPDQYQAERAKILQGD